MLITVGDIPVRLPTLQEVVNSPIIYILEVRIIDILYIVPDIIKFTYYHCTSIDYNVLCERSTLYFECTTQYYNLVLCYHLQI